MVYLSFVQQLDRDADGARHGGDDDAEFLSGCDCMLRIAVARMGRVVRQGVEEAVLRGVGQSSVVGCFDVRSKVQASWDLAKLVQCTSADHFIDNYIYI